MKLLKDAYALVASRWRLMAQFLTLQGITAAGNVLYGVLCVRLLPTADYAKFVVLFGVQNTVLILMDANFSNSLVPLVGEHVDDHRMIADYVASLRQLSHWAYLLVGAGLVVLFPELVHNRGWTLGTVAAMVLLLLLSTWFMRQSAQYGAVLILLRERSRWYRGQMVSSLGTLALLGIVWAMHGLSAFAAILINVAGIVYVGVYYAAQARSLLGLRGRPSQAKRSAIVRLALPNMPQSLFYAVQGQISLFLITLFGRTAGVASLGALGRLNAIYMIAAQMHPLIVEPYFAKLPRSQVRKSYGLVMSLTVLLAAAVTLAGYFYPEVFLWILGPQYSHLRFEVFLVLATASANFVGGALWCIHGARRFVYWWASALNIGGILVVQVLFIWKGNVSNLRTLLWLNLSTMGVMLAVNVLSGVAGFTLGPRSVGHGAELNPEYALEDLNPVTFEEKQETLAAADAAKSGGQAG
jgi:O-antigen/teichoic acid export membrane protein